MKGVGVSVESRPEVERSTSAANNCMQKTWTNFTQKTPVPFGVRSFRGAEVFLPFLGILVGVQCSMFMCIRFQLEAESSLSVGFLNFNTEKG
jgi:hypothetical protein